MNYSLAISNIAWEKESDNEVYALMKEFGIKGLEIAPSRIWEDPYSQDDTTILQWRNMLNQEGFSVQSIQSLLFGHPELVLFKDTDTTERLLDYLKGVITLAGKLGAPALVFGSPKNRIAGTLTKEEVLAIALPFFRELGRHALAHNTCFCIEANPSFYGGDFILTTKEAIDLVILVDHPGFRLNIDLGTITLNNEDLETTLKEALPHAGHFHISEPGLEQITFDPQKHFLIKKILDASGYSKTVSIEMKRVEPPSENIAIIRNTIKFIYDIYATK